MHFIREAGHGIWPVLFFGIAALVVAAKQAHAPAPGRTVTALWLMGLSVVMGILASAVGMQTSADALPGVVPDERWIFFLGMSEALYNLVVSLVLVALSMLFLLFAHLRSTPLSHARESAAAAPRGDDLQRAAVDSV